MKPLFLLAAALLPAVVSASPVHVSLRASAVVQPGTDNLFSLGSVADLSGGTPAERARLAAISVGRAPLPNETREITGGDLALKLRQAGFQPGRDALISGAAQADITVGSSPAVLPLPVKTAEQSGVPAVPTSTAPQILIHAGAPVTIRIDDGDLSITTIGIAETSGAAGDLIRIHRTGMSTELDATVLDSQTVSLEP